MSGLQTMVRAPGAIDQRVSQVRWRLNRNRVMDRLVVTLFWGLSAVALVWVVDAIFWLDLPRWTMAGALLGVAALVGLGLALARLTDSGTAARELDREFSLKDRVSSALLCRGESWADLVVADAEAHAARVDPRNAFRPVWPRIVRWYPVPLVLCLLAQTVLPKLDVLGRAEAVQAARKEQKEAERKSQLVEKAVRDLESKAKLKEHGALKDLAEKLEAISKDLANKDKEKQKQAMAEMSKLKDGLEEKREAMEGLRKSAEDMKDLNPGGGMDDVRRSLKDGDLGKAADQMKALAAELKEAGDAKASELEKKARELEALSKDLKGLGDKQRQLDRLDSGKTDFSGLDELMKQAADQLPEAREFAGEALDLSSLEMKELEKLLKDDAATRELLEQVKALQEQLAQGGTPGGEPCSLCGQQKCQEQHAGGG